MQSTQKVSAVMVVHNSSNPWIMNPKLSNIGGSRKPCQGIRSPKVNGTKYFDTKR